MSRRKDTKERVLRDGESQRKDLIYQYRFTDIRGKMKDLVQKAGQADRFEIASAAISTEEIGIPDRKHRVNGGVGLIALNRGKALCTI